MLLIILYYNPLWYEVFILAYFSFSNSSHVLLCSRYDLSKLRSAETHEHHKGSCLIQHTRFREVSGDRVLYNTWGSETSKVFVSHTIHEVHRRQWGSCPIQYTRFKNVRRVFLIQNIRFRDIRKVRASYSIWGSLTPQGFMCYTAHEVRKSHVQNTAGSGSPEGFTTEMTTRTFAQSLLPAPISDVWAMEWTRNFAS